MTHYPFHISQEEIQRINELRLVFSLTGNYNHISLSAKDVFYILYTRAEEIKKRRISCIDTFIPYFCDIQDSIHFANLCYEDIDINRMYIQIARLLEMSSNEVMGLPRIKPDNLINAGTVTSTWSAKYYGNIPIIPYKDE